MMIYPFIVLPCITFYLYYSYFRWRILKVGESLQENRFELMVPICKSVFHIFAVFPSLCVPANPKLISSNSHETPHNESVQLCKIWPSLGAPLSVLKGILPGGLSN